MFAGPYAVGDMTSGAVTPDFRRTVQVYDGEGVSHRLNLAFLKTGANGWATEVSADPPSDVTAAGGLLASGDIAFNGDGSINVGASSPALFAPLAIGWTNGATTVPIDLALGADGTAAGFSQFGGQSALIASSVDGGVLGSIEQVTISAEGVVSAVFSDGSSRAVFQLPAATFTNPDGLQRTSLNAFQPTSDSGAPAINAPGVAGAGKLSPSALEASTADLGKSLTDLIVVQRAYSASTKIITTADEMLQELTNLKR